MDGSNNFLPNNISPPPSMEFCETLNFVPL